MWRRFGQKVHLVSGPKPKHLAQSFPVLVLAAVSILKISINEQAVEADVHRSTVRKTSRDEFSESFEPNPA